MRLVVAKEEFGRCTGKKKLWKSMPTLGPARVHMYVDEVPGSVTAQGR